MSGSKVFVEKSSRESDSRKVIVPVAGIGASAGCIEALKVLFSHMPVDTGMAFVIVLHLDPAHKSMVSEILSQYTSMPVKQASEGMQIEADHVYVTPSEQDLCMREGSPLLHTISRTESLHLPIDLFFNSLAGVQGEQAVAIVLSGTGSDGSMGLQAIKNSGGMVMVQSPDEAQFDGMPNSAIATGLVDRILSVADMGEELLAYLRHKTDWQGTDTVPDMAYKAILGCVQTQLGYNFYDYKPSTILRRINRRLALNKLHSIEQYADYLPVHPEEIEALFGEMLIGVTSFFRDPESWAVLQAEFLDKLDLINLQPLRIWVPGCSSGEEVYSIAILLHEFMVQHKLNFSYQIFATDIDTRALAFARKGIYPEGIAANLSEKRLDRFFLKHANGYRVQPFLRESITFSEQNLVSDPPYSRMHLVICRNLFIYLQSAMQEKILATFHFSLLPQGLLLLGGSESVTEASGMFSSVSKKWRLYRKLEGSGAANLYPSMNLAKKYGSATNMQELPERKPLIRLTDIARQVLLREYVPASMLLNSRYQVLFHFGETSDFLHYPEGESTDDLFSLLREGLTTRVRSAVQKAFRDQVGVRVRGAKFKRDGKQYGVSFRVKRLPAVDGAEDLLLLSFEYEKQDKKTPAGVSTDVQLADAPLVQQLERELKDTREELQDAIEELTASNEELKAAHEEAISTNEELQSSNEELEASKEELQSFNEELNTVNTELQEKVQSLEVANNDVKNLIDSTKHASVFLDVEGRIKFFTPSAKKLFKLIESDMGRPLSDIVSKVEDSNLQREAAQVIQTREESKREVLQQDGRWFNRRILPYLTIDNRLQGVVISFDDITEVRTALDKVRKSKQQYQGLFRNMMNGFAVHEIVCNKKGEPVDYIYLEVNDAFERLTGMHADQVVGRKVTEVIPGIEKDAADWIGRYGKVALGGGSIKFEEYSQALGKWFSVLAYSAGHGRFATVFEDITEQKQALEKIADSEKRFRATFEQAAVGIAHVALDGKWMRVNQRLPDMLGYTMQELLGMTFQDITHPDDLDADLKQMHQLLDGDIDTYSMEKRYFRKDASILWINLTAALVRKEDGSPDYFISVVEDISRRKEAMQRLIESEERQRFTLERLHIGAWDVNLVTRKATRSAEHRRIFGYADALEHWSFDLFFQHVLPEYHEDIKRVMAEAREGKTDWSFECRIRRSNDGEIRWISITGRPYTNAEGQECVSGIAQDITEQKQAELDLLESRELFHQSQKMEALGTLVGGIAHDFNNILAGITGNIYLASQKVGAIPDAAEHLSSAEKLSFRAADLIKHLLTFARKDQIVMKPIPLAPFIKEMLKFMRTTVPESIAIQVDVSSEAGLLILGDATQLHQVLMNLINNARDALEGVDDPRIRVKLQTIKAERAFIHAHAEANAAEYAHLVIEDNGCGIPEDAIDHVFEPFFTTKEQGKGTGLGLAMAFGAMQSHHGFIELQSTSGEGTTFHIYLPLIEHDIDQTESPDDLSVCMLGNGETILFVDDNTQVVGTARQVLEEMGYKVLTANCGQEAIDIFAVEQQKIALTIMDIVMPGMDGGEAVEKIREIRPDAKVLYSTGYDRVEALKVNARLENATVISKPYNYDKLNRLIRELLDH